MSTENNPKNPQYQVKITDDLEAGVYTNAISIHFNNNECVLDFAYNVPNGGTPLIKVVSRINMSHKTAESLLNVLSNGILDWKNREKEMRNKEKENG